MNILFIRHGKTKGNLEKRYIGVTDQPLSEEGILQLKTYFEKGIYPKADKVVVSPLKRCRQTAALIYPTQEVIVVEDFKECNFGIFENQNYRDLKGNTKYQAWINSNGTMPFPNGESMEQFQHRCTQAFLSLMKDMEQKNKTVETVAMVVHGGTIMSILSQLCIVEEFKDGRPVQKKQAYFDWMVENAEGHLCKWDNHQLIWLGKLERL